VGIDLRHSLVRHNFVYTQGKNLFENIKERNHLEHLSVYLNDITGDINPLKPKFVQRIFKNLVGTSKKTPRFYFSKINWVMLDKEMSPIYNQKK
jgi:hypothetical protein